LSAVLVEPESSKPVLPDTVNDEWIVIDEAQARHAAAPTFEQSFFEPGPVQASSSTEQLTTLDVQESDSDMSYFENIPDDVSEVLAEDIVTIIDGDDEPQRNIPIETEVQPIVCCSYDTAPMDFVVPVETLATTQYDRTNPFADPMPQDVFSSSHPVQSTDLFTWEAQPAGFVTTQAETSLYDASHQFSSDLPYQPAQRDSVAPEHPNQTYGADLDADYHQYTQFKHSADQFVTSQAQYEDSQQSGYNTGFEAHSDVPPSHFGYESTYEHTTADPYAYQTQFAQTTNEQTADQYGYQTTGFTSNDPFEFGAGLASTVTQSTTTTDQYGYITHSTRGEQSAEPSQEQFTSDAQSDASFYQTETNARFGYQLSEQFGFGQLSKDVFSRDQMDDLEARYAGVPLSSSSTHDDDTSADTTQSDIQILQPDYQLRQNLPFQEDHSEQTITLSESDDALASIRLMDSGISQSLIISDEFQQRSVSQSQAEAANSLQSSCLTGSDEGELVFDPDEFERIEKDGRVLYVKVTDHEVHETTIEPVDEERAQTPRPELSDDSSSSLLDFGNRDSMNVAGVKYSSEGMKVDTMDFAKIVGTRQDISHDFSGSRVDVNTDESTTTDVSAATKSKEIVVNTEETTEEPKLETETKIEILPDGTVVTRKITKTTRKRIVAKSILTKSEEGEVTITSADKSREKIRKFLSTDGATATTANSNRQGTSAEDFANISKTTFEGISDIERQHAEDLPVDTAVARTITLVQEQTTCIEGEQCNAATE